MMTTRGGRALKRAAALGLACMLAGCRSNPQAAKQKYLASGDQYLASGKVAEAVIEYRNAVQQDPRAGDAREKLGDAYAKAGTGGKAIEEYLRASDLLPDDSGVHVKTGTLLLAAGRFEDAKFWAEKILARNPKNLQAQLLLANALAGLKDLDAAVKEIEEAIQLDPNRGETYSSLGMLQMGRGQKDAAERAFRKAIEIDGRSITAHLALANFYWLNSRSPEAEAELTRAAELDPENAIVHRSLSTFYLTTNRAADAEPHLKKVLEITKAPAAALALADFYAVQKNEGAARAALEPLTKDKATATLAEVRLATLDYGAGQRTGASDRLARVLQTDPNNLNALLLKSAWLMTDGRLEDALASATLATEKHSESPAAFFTLGRVQASRHQTEAAIAAFQHVLQLNPLANDAKLALSQLNLTAGRADASLTLAQEVAKTEPANLDARLTLVRGLLTRKDFTRAQAELDGLLARAPDAAIVHVLVGVLKGYKNDPAAARKSFERALQLDPDSVDALGGLIAVDLADKQVATARARIDERVRRSGSEPAVLMLASRTYAAAGDPQTSETMLRRVLEIDPSYLDAYGALAQLYMSQRRVDLALAEFDQLAKRQQRPIAALTLAGMILQGQGKVAEARDHYERVLDLDPEAAVAANNLAWMYSEMPDKLDLALDLAQRAKAKLPDQPEVNDTIGWVHVKKNRGSEAVPYFQRSIERDTNNPTYHYHLGLAYAQTGDTQRARRALERALSLKPDFPDAPDARSALAKLGS